MSNEVDEVRLEYSVTRNELVEVGRLYRDDGLLLLDTDPHYWIESANPADRLCVLSLELVGYGVKNIDIDRVSMLNNLQRLVLRGFSELKELPENLGDLGSLICLSIVWCRRIKWLPNSIGKLSNLKVLTIYHCDFLKELPATLGELTKLSLLNIEFTKIKWLPRSIAKLSKLSVLLLPFHFRLQTLPSHLNDSLVISAPNISIRKTWAELKTEIQLSSIPVFGAGAAHFPSTPAYLQYEGDPRPWIQENNLCSLVRILDLKLWRYQCKDGISESNEDLPMLTHLYISGGCLFHLPVTLTKITHLSLYRCRLECEIQACFDSLAKLSTLQSLELLRCDEDLPAHMDLPVSLTHLTLKSDEYDSLPDSFVSSINKLPNLKSLALIDYQYVDLSLLNVNLVKLKLWDCRIINSLLPKGLRHLEIMHSKDFCDNTWNHHDEELELWLYNLVNPETLSDFSVTCTKIQSLPTIEGLLNVQQLHLQDCFNLKKLPQNMDKLVNLRFINASGTRIKSLPDSFTNLQNLQRLILPKCFAFKSLSHNFQKKVTVIEDNTDDCYYMKEGYYDSRYDSREDCRFSSGSHFSGRTEQVDNVVLGSLNHELRAENEDCVEPVDVDDYLNSSETDEHHTPTISQVDTAANEHEVSENNPHVQRTVMFPSSAANANSSLQETTLNESNNVQAFPNRETDDMEIEQCRKERPK